LFQSIEEVGKFKRLHACARIIISSMSMSTRKGRVDSISETAQSQNINPRAVYTWH